MSRFEFRLGTTATLFATLGSVTANANGLVDSVFGKAADRSSPGDAGG
jgi:hypothetical protein